MSDASKRAGQLAELRTTLERHKQRLKEFTEKLAAGGTEGERSLWEAKRTWYLQHIAGEECALEDLVTWKRDFF